MRYEATVQVKPDVLKEMNRILDLDVGLEDTKDGNTIQTFYADFYNYYQADIKVCNGSKDSSPWIDAVLFDKDGNELTCFVGEISLDGEYIFRYGNDKFVVIVKEEIE